MDSNKYAYGTYTYKSITFGTFGAFGSGTWDVIERACDPRTHPD
eukprot:COSAG06_NODE_27987_length_582_cov_6.060041_1_plen_43_part_10